MTGGQERETARGGLNQETSTDSPRKMGCLEKETMRGLKEREWGSSKRRPSSAPRASEISPSRTSGGACTRPQAGWSAQGPASRRSILSRAAGTAIRPANEARLRLATTCGGGQSPQSSRVRYSPLNILRLASVTPDGPGHWAGRP
jgi:hypothetical protein